MKQRLGETLWNGELKFGMYFCTDPGLRTPLLGLKIAFIFVICNLPALTCLPGGSQRVEEELGERHIVNIENMTSSVKISALLRVKTHTWKSYM